MRTTTIRKGGLAIAAAAALTLSACGSDDGGDMNGAESGSEMSSSESMPSSDDMSMTSPMSEDESADPMANLVGSGCSEYAEANPDGPGSVDGMAKEPVATAASNNPMLTTLTAAVSGEVNPDVNLVDTLNGGEFTVFAPVDEAFDAVDDATMDSLGTDADLLTTVLSHHVVEGKINPADIDGTHTTLAGDDVTVSGEGDDLMVDDAKVVCGGVQTANAVVYLVDGVLMPKE